MVFSPVMRIPFDPILFDLDGTLVDSSQDIAAAVNRTLESLGISRLPEPEIVGFVGDGVRKLMLRTLQRDPRADVDRAVAVFKSDYRQNCLNATQAYPGMAAVLQACAGVQLGVVTNKPIDFASEILEGLGILHHFGAVVGGDEAPLKPDPAPIRLALERLGATADGGLMIGDHANDIHAGRAAGLHTCGVTWGFDGGRLVSQSDPDHLCPSPKALENILKSR